MTFYTDIDECNRRIEKLEAVVYVAKGYLRPVSTKTYPFSRWFADLSANFQDALAALDAPEEAQDD